MGEELKKSVDVEDNKVLVKNVTISKGPKDNRLWETVVSYTLDFTGFNLNELLILAARSVIIDLARARNEKGATAATVKKTLDGKTFVWEDFKPTRKKSREPATAAEVGELFLKKASEDDIEEMIRKLEAMKAAKAGEQAQDENEDDSEE